MKKIEPYKSKTEALQILDNGGRFYNFLTKASDGVINTSELREVAGGFNSKRQMILFLEMSIINLSEAEQTEIFESLDSSLQKMFSKYRHLKLTVSNAKTEGKKSSNAIITGIPKLIDKNTQFEGFILVPVVTGNVTTFMTIPFLDEYDVYELQDQGSFDTILIAQSKDAGKLPPKKVTLGGELKEMLKSENEKGEKELYLDAIYYLDQ